jgi:curved DNA-binding protein CbpA
MNSRGFVRYFLGRCLCGSEDRNQGSANLQEDPFLILGLDQDADDDEAIKRTYLMLVRQFSPERDPARFQDIRTAYEAVRDQRGRLRARLLRPGRSGVARLKRSLLQSGLEGIADQPPGRASWKTVEAVLLEGLITAVRRQLTSSLPHPAKLPPSQGEESGNHSNG